MYAGLEAGSTCSHSYGSAQHTHAVTPLLFACIIGCRSFSCISCSPLSVRARQRSCGPWRFVLFRSWGTRSMQRVPRVPSAPTSCPGERSPCHQTRREAFRVDTSDRLTDRMVVARNASATCSVLVSSHCPSVCEGHPNFRFDSGRSTLTPFIVPCHSVASARRITLTVAASSLLGLKPREDPFLMTVIAAFSLGHLTKVDPP